LVTITFHAADADAQQSSQATRPSPCGATRLRTPNSDKR
jgi:hypothetical protein